MKTLKHVICDKCNGLKTVKKKVKPHLKHIVFPLKPCPRCNGRGIICKEV